MKQPFSFRRYRLLLTKYIREQYRLQILLFAITLLIFIGIRAVGHLFVYTTSAGDIIDEGITVSLMLQYIYMFAAASLLFAYQTAHSMPYMRSRVQHISYLMIPASNGEKFAASVTISYCLPLIYSFLAFHLSNLIQMPFSGVWMRIGMDFSEVGTQIFLADPRFLSWIKDFSSAVMVYGIAGVIFSGAWYSASATLFRRHPFLLGSVIIYLIGQVFGFALLLANFSLFDNAASDPAGVLSLMTNYFYVMAAIYAALAPALYILAYRRMKSAEV